MYLCREGPAEGVMFEVLIQFDGVLLRLSFVFRFFFLCLEVVIALESADPPVYQMVQL